MFSFVVESALLIIHGIIYVLVFTMPASSRQSYVTALLLLAGMALLLTGIVCICGIVTPLTFTLMLFTLCTVWIIVEHDERHRASAEKEYDLRRRHAKLCFSLGTLELKYGIKIEALKLLLVKQGIREFSLAAVENEIGLAVEQKNQAIITDPEIREKMHELIKTSFIDVLTKAEEQKEIEAKVARLKTLCGSNK